MDRIKAILKDYKGGSPVYVIESSGRRLAAPESLWVDGSAALISRLEEILEKENVKFVE